MLKLQKKCLYLFLIINIFVNIIKPVNNQVNYPIDIVYLWVDGNDPEWLEIKNYHVNLWQKRHKSTTTGQYSDNRFANHEELRYSLRSIYKFVPFFNHIYIVTMNQRPNWLLDDPRITIIDHKEIFKNLDNLPTFNSQAIESHIHRIPNLSENFIYLNDDFFLGETLKPENFFSESGKIKVLFEKRLSPSGPHIEGESAYRRAWRNTNALLDKCYLTERRHRLAHSPYALRKSFIELAEKEFGFVFETNSSHKFRSDHDYTLTNGFLQFYWKYNDKMEVVSDTGDYSLTNILVNLKNDNFFEETKQELDKIKNSRPSTFCLEDEMGENSEKTKCLLRDFLNEYYPEPAPWEK